MMELNVPNPLIVMMALAVLSLAPFVAMMVTSYVKIVVVFSLVRNALSIQQIPPNMVLNGLAMILSMYVMAPVVQQGYRSLRELDVENASFAEIETAVSGAMEPLKGFLAKHAAEREVDFFHASASRLWEPEQVEKLSRNDLWVLVPAFTITELQHAFLIGFLVYLPFVAIDLIVSNVLLSMGMMMVSPVTIAIPFKLLLFVVVDGWTQLAHSLILSYA
ncbi:MAG: hypothetical protein RLZZ436_4233 [Planctomycetota bacterium]|jgi:type III secretion protein R